MVGLGGNKDPRLSVVSNGGANLFGFGSEMEKWLVIVDTIFLGEQITGQRGCSHLQ
jgi:hypothetical protein